MSLCGRSIHVGSPNLVEESRLFSDLYDILKKRWFTNNGDYVRYFEKRLAEKLGVKHCVVVSNATTGLEIALKACGVVGEVIVPSFTFIATNSALRWLNIKPVFCDVSLEDHNIDPFEVKKLITSDTSAILGVHLWGRPCAVEELNKIAEENNLHIIYDAAHAFGCSYKNKMIGNFGDVEVFSFHATKFFNTFEGGAIATNDDEIARDARSMKNFGFEDGMIRSFGINGKMSEICAALGIIMLDNLGAIIDKNYKNYQTYLNEFKNVNNIKLIHYDGNEKNNYQYVVVEMDKRDYVMQKLISEEVFVKDYFYPCHKLEIYDDGSALKNTELLSSRTMCLPTGMDISKEEIIKICDYIKELLNE